METNFVMSTSPQKSSDMILNQIKTSNLHFIANETPYSLYVTIRKKFLKAPSLSTPGGQQQVQFDRKLLEENAMLRENLHRVENELLEVTEILNTKSDKLQKSNYQISELMSRNIFLEKESKTKTEKIQILRVDTNRLEAELSTGKNEVSKMKKVLKIKEKESHNSQTKLNNLEDTLAKNKLEKTALDREVYNLKNSVKILEKKCTKKDNNNERSVLAKIPNLVSTRAPKIPNNLEKDPRNVDVEEALKTDAKYNSSSADTKETEDENLKNLYNIPISKNLFEILSDSDDIITNSKASINNNIPSTISLNPTNRINPDLRHDATSSAMDMAKSSDNADPNIDEKDSEVRVEENFELENEEEDFSHLSAEEQVILKQISRIVKGSFS
jgi:hypothetical protein